MGWRSVSALPLRRPPCVHGPLDREHRQTVRAVAGDRLARGRARLRRCDTRRVEATSDGLPRDGVLRLRDGRALAYREWGDLGGSPVVFVHGTPCSGVWCPDPHQDATRAVAVRLISVDRPGIGGSDVQLGLTVGGWVADVAELADGLELERFGLVGFSAGGPWAAACAALIPERLTGVGIASSRALAEYNLRERPQAVEEFDEDDRHEFELVRELGPEGAAKRLAVDNEKWARGLFEHPEQFLAGFEPPEGDRWFWEDPLQVELLLEGFREYGRQGALGNALESVAIMQPWNFRLADIPIPVHLWHGEQDPRVRLYTQEFAAETIPDAHLTIWRDAGHLGMAKHWREVLEAVTAAR
jgi:pimeloyl-ACP methyl ester carboxylesterase